MSVLQLQIVKPGAGALRDTVVGVGRGVDVGRLVGVAVTWRGVAVGVAVTKIIRVSTGNVDCVGLVTASST